MTRLTIGLGAVLVVTGLVAYFATGTSSLTAMIPAFVGGLILICAAIANQPKLHRHGIHAALVVALIGVLGSLMNVVKVGQLFTGAAERPAAIVTSLIMFVLCAAYVAVGVRSFVQARRTRSA